MRSSNWPRYLVPATIMARSSTTIRLSASNSGTLPLITRWAKPSTMAVLPTPASPSSTGLFLVRRQRTWIARSISRSRPITGSSLFCLANSVRSRPKLSSAGVFDLPPLAAARRLATGFPPTALALATFESVAQQIQDFLPHLLQLQSQVHQHLGRDALLLAQQSQQDVLGAHVVVVQIPRFLHRVLDDLLGPRRLRQLAHRDHLGTALDQLLDLQTDLAQVHVEVLQHVGGHAAAFLHQAEQDVLRADVLVVEPLCFLIGQLHDLARAVRKSFVHGNLPSNSRPSRQVSVLSSPLESRPASWAIG